MSVLDFVTLALNYAATTYGYQEYMCGDVGKAVRCDEDANTASGDSFDPNALAAAVPMPRHIIMRPVEIRILNYTGRCVTLTINDKKNQRFIGTSGLDLTPAAVTAITGKPATKTWGGKLISCGSSVTLTETYNTTVITQEEFYL